jgi:iron complex outermembrane receptor protein
MPAKHHTIWGAVSRAVRTPSRIDTELALPGTPPHTLVGVNSFESEKLLAYELGYRTEINHRLSASVSTFFHDYDDLRSLEPLPGRPGTQVIRNELDAETYGVELSTTWQVLDSWRLRGGYTYFEKHIIFGDSRDVNRGTGEGNDPHHQFLVQSIVNLPWNLDFDAVLRYVDNLNQRGPTVPSYVSLDLRLAWHPSRAWEIALVGQNLLDDQHPEFGRPGVRQEIPRSIYGKVTWKF